MAEHDSEEPGIVICGNREKLTNNEPISGTTLDLCADCGATISISPSGRKQASEKNFKLVCLNCGMVIMRREGIVRPEPPTKEQMTEIIDALARVAKQSWD